MIEEDNHTHRNDGDWEKMELGDDAEWMEFKAYVTAEIWSSEITPSDLEPD